MTNISVNNVYVKYIFIYPCSQSKLCLFQNSMSFPWVTDPEFKDFFPWIFQFCKFQELFMKFNDFSMILKWSEFQWFFKSCGNPVNTNVTGDGEKVELFTVTKVIEDNEHEVQFQHKYYLSNYRCSHFNQNSKTGDVAYVYWNGLLTKW